MMKGVESTEFQRNLRHSIVAHLQLLASAEAQLKFQRDVPFVNVTVELVCMWFDDNYLPTDEEFLAAFSERELQSMATFNQIFDLISANSLRGEELPCIEEFIEMPEWKVLSEAAATALLAFK